MSTVRAEAGGVVLVCSLGELLITVPERKHTGKPIKDPNGFFDGPLCGGGPGGFIQPVQHRVRFRDFLSAS